MCFVVNFWVELVICTICVVKWLLKHLNVRRTEWLLLIDCHHLHSSIWDSRGHFKANQLKKESFWLSPVKSHFKTSHFQKIDLKMPLQTLIKCWQIRSMRCFGYGWSGSIAGKNRCKSKNLVKCLILNWIIFKMSHFQTNSST